jgi:2,3,4,5-tetrahydropyridine-2-carboxylate N-succinyltransferase
VSLDGREPSSAAAQVPGGRVEPFDPVALGRRIEALSAAWFAANGALDAVLIETGHALVAELMGHLEAGRVRAALPDPGAEGGWRVEAWVKTGILLAFRLPGMTEVRDGPILAGRDRSSLGTLDVLESEASQAATAAGSPWRIVPGGTSVRRGAYLAPGVAIIPPAFVNTGAWVGEGSMIDSHVLVGSCAQVGRDVHLAASVQVGGVLEPPGARPVIVEDGAFIGGGSGLYEGITVGSRAVIGAGVILTGQSRLVDLVQERELRGEPGAPLIVPPDAVVVPGTRPAVSPWARQRGIAVSVPVIVKYRDAGTAARVALEDALR